MSKKIDLFSKVGRPGHLQDSLETFIKSLPRGTHLTAPEVYKKAREAGLSVSLSTVYRTLHHLSEQGQVQALSGEHGRRYESSDSAHEHDHLICLKCGITIEFEDELIRGFGSSVAERKGYEYRNSRFDILGICNNCKSTGIDRRLDGILNTLEKTMVQAESIASNCEEAMGLIEINKIAEGRELLASTLSLLKECTQEVERAITMEIGSKIDE